jgi:hypothetical protein
MFSSTIGSVSPRSSPTTGLAKSGRSSPKSRVRSQADLAEANLPNHSTASVRSTIGACDSASVPPARISSAWPFWM